MFVVRLGKAYEVFITESKLIPQSLSGTWESEYLIKFDSGGFK
jgi:hypothetical protein